MIACPHCRQNIALDASLAGQLVVCPYCGGQFHMPGSQPVFVVPKQTTRKRKAKSNTLTYFLGGLGVMVLVCCGGCPLVFMTQSASIQADVAKEQARQKRERLPDDCNGHQWKSATAWAKADFVTRNRRYVSDADRPYLVLPNVKELVQSIDYRCESAGKGTFDFQLNDSITSLLHEIERDKTETIAEYKERTKREAREVEAIHELQEAVRRSRN